MPFEPRLFGPGPEPEDERPEDFCDLPDDLAALGQQLSDDASRLADTYPAFAPETWISHDGVSPATLPAVPVAAVPEVRSPWRRVAAAVVLIAAAGGSLWVAGRQAENPPEAQLRVASEAAAQQRARATAVSAPAEASRIVPAGVFRSLSSPEQEALLDLMEEENLRQASLSI